MAELDQMWLNWIKSDFALNGTDHRTQAEQRDAIAGYLRWRNARAQHKRDFAPGSVIRIRTGYRNEVA